MSSRKIALIAVIVFALLNGASAAFTKKGVEEIPPLTFAMLRMTLASLCVLPFFLKQKGNIVSQIRDITPISLFATINVTFFILGMQFTAGNTGMVVYSAVPLLTGMILFLFFKEKFSLGKISGIVIGFIGVLLITFLPLLEQGNPFVGNLLGNSFLIIAVISWSFYMVYSKKKLQKKYSPFLVTCNFIFVTTITLFPFFLWDLDKNFGWWDQVTGWGILAVFYTGVVITVGAYLLNQYAIKHGGAVFAATTFYLFPIFGFVTNYFLLGENVTLGLLIGTVLALVGVALVLRK